MMGSERDPVLWERANGGDADAFGELFERHNHRVYAFCFRSTGDRTLADDLTSATFLEAWRRVSKVSLATDSALPWLLGVASNVLRNQRRSLRRYSHALSRMPPLDVERDFSDTLTEQLDFESQARVVLTVLRDLPKGEFDVIALIVFGELTPREAAHGLGVSEATVRTRLFRARQRLVQSDLLPAEDVPLKPMSVGERNI